MLLVFAMTYRLNRRALKKCRVDRGWSLTRAAGEIGISPQALNYLERGMTQPRADTLQRIAVAYGRLTEEFFFRGNGR